jgi:hypothetical protein
MKLLLSVRTCNISYLTYPLGTILLLTEYNCRISWHGITTLSFNQVFKINKWNDYYDLDELNAHLKGCDVSFEF